MANNVGGDELVLSRRQVTATANLVDKTLVTAAGAAVANAANTAFGVLQNDTTNTDLAALKYGIVEIIATGTVTAGGFVEALISTFTTKDTTGVNGAGVQDGTGTNYVVGRAITGGSVNDTVLVDMTDKPAKIG